jgi:hypothetical protein
LLKNNFNFEIRLPCEIAVVKFMCVCCDCFHKSTKMFLFMGEMTWKILCLSSYFNVFSIKRVDRALLPSLNYCSSWNESRIYNWTVVYLSRILSCSHFLSVSRRASCYKFFKSMIKCFIIQDMKRNCSLVSTESGTQKFT